MDSKIVIQVEAEEYSDDDFEVLAPLGDAASLSAPGVDCESCCPGSCTGCTQCNKCNMIF